MYAVTDDNKALLEQRYPDLKKKLFGAMQRYPLYGWDLEKMEK